MTKKRNAKCTQISDCEVIPATPSPPRLGTIRDVRREMARIYCDARTGLIDTKDAARLTYMLGAIAGAICDDEIEARIEKLEEATKHES